MTRKTEMPEEWRSIPFLNGYYEVSNSGRIRRAKPGMRTEVGRILTPRRNKYGYLTFDAKYPGEKSIKKPLVHRCVAAMFLPPPGPGQTQVNHKNGIKYDNRAENLEWCTPGENLLHARDTGLLNDRIPVVQLEKDGTFVARYRSIAEASRSTGIRAALIYLVCVHYVYKSNGRRVLSSGGFVWRTEKEYQEGLNGSV